MQISYAIKDIQKKKKAKQKKNTEEIRKLIPYRRRNINICRAIAIFREILLLLILFLHFICNVYVMLI